MTDLSWSVFIYKKIVSGDNGKMTPAGVEVIPGSGVATRRCPMAIFLDEWYYSEDRSLNKQEDQSLNKPEDLSLINMES